MATPEYLILDGHPTLLDALPEFAALWGELVEAAEVER